MAEAEAARRASIVSKHVGNVGDKMERDVKVEAEIPFESEYGGGRIYKFVDGEGNEFVWMTSAVLVMGKDEDGYERYADVGDSLRIKFTVKAHEEYNCVPQTMIFRVKVIA